MDGKIFKRKNGFAIFDQMGALMIGLLVLSIIAIVVFAVLAQAGTTSVVANNANATAAVNSLTEAADDPIEWVPITVVAFMGVLLVGLAMLLKRRT